MAWLFVAGLALLAVGMFTGPGSHLPGAVAPFLVRGDAIAHLRSGLAGRGRRRLSASRSSLTRESAR